MFCLLTLSVFFLLMQSSCPRQLLLPYYLLKGGSKGGRRKHQSLIYCLCRAKTRGGEREKRKGSFPERRIGLKIFESKSVWGLGGKKETDIYKPLGGFFTACFHPCFSTALLYRSPHACAVYSAFPSLCVHFGTCHFFPQRLQKAPGNYPECHSVCQLLSPWGCTDGAPRRLRE